LDWNDLRDFLAISRHRTLSAAAAALGVEQSTMGRRLKALEQRAGAHLLQKTPSGYVLTEAGAAILENVERIEAEAQAVARAIAGRDGRLEGTVRLTAIEDLAVVVLMPILAAFCARYPGIVLELIADQRLLSLTRGEADIALRADRFTQNDLAARKVADFAFAAYAAPAYLAARGRPDLARGASGHVTLPPPAAMSDSPQAQWFEALTGAARPGLRANTFHTLVAAGEAGMGIVCLPRFLGDASGLTRLAAPLPAPPRELWLGIHKDIRDTPRFRVMSDFLAAALKRQSVKLNPPTDGPAAA
jgi:DNA-binding transcriptional LysR family regulator